MDSETVKISMTITESTEQWLSDTYPEAQSTQEALRMAVSDARQHNISVREVTVCDDH
jgi:hypothetical protein